MIRAIILDIDGVLIGAKTGFNSPDPHPAVMEKLKHLKRSGMIISFSTGKAPFSLKPLVAELQLDNPHISAGGSVIINPIRDQVISVNSIDTDTAKSVIGLYQANNVYIELYSINDYFVQKSQVCEITKIHDGIITRKPIITESLAVASETNVITKLEAVAWDERQQAEVSDLFKPFRDRLVLSWGILPMASPLQFGIITAFGVSKGTGAMKVSEAMGVPFENVLGVGDSTSDWNFLKLCKYAAAMGNASTDLKNLVMQKGEGFGYVGRSVDENGIIEILDHFLAGSR